MTGGATDPVWEAVVAYMLPLGPIREQRSQYAEKPALVTAAGREIAHSEADGVVDVRITRAGWRRISLSYGDDPRVQPRARSDWIELHLTAGDVAAMGDLLAQVAHANLT